MSTRTPTTENKPDSESEYNPGALKAAERFPEAYTSHGADQAEAFANDPKNASPKSEGQSTTGTTQQPDPSTNIKNAKEGEEKAPWEDKTGGGKKSSRLIGVLKGLKRRSPMILIIGTIIGGGSIFTILFSPSTLLLQMRNTLLDKFNDQVAAMDVRSIYILSKKIDNDITQGACGKITLMCKMKTMSSKQVKKLEAAGITVNGKETLFGTRMKAKSFTYNGKKYGPADLKKAVRTDPEFRRAMMKGYNPRFAAFSDAIFEKFAQRVKITKERNIDGTKTKEEMNQEMVEVASGDAGTRLNANVAVEEDDNGNKHYYDLSTDPRTEIPEAKYNEILENSKAADLEIQKQKELKDIGKSTVKGTAKKILTATALGLGAVDSACSGYTVIRAASFAAKYLGSLQTLRLYQSFNNSADSILALAAQPSVIEFWGNKLMNHPNADGHTATDGAYRYPAFGDTNIIPTNANIGANITDARTQGLSEADAERVAINEETTRYVNGQTLSAGVFGQILSFVGKGSSTTDAVDSTCKFVKSGWGQTIIFGTAIVGAVAAFFSGGATLGWGIAVQTAVNIAMGIAIATLTPKLVALAAGRLINGSENSNEMGAALVSGAGSYNDLVSQTRAIPAITPEDAVEYNEIAMDVQQQYAAVDRLERSPLDPTSKNTFVGSIVSNYLPYFSKLSSVGGGIVSTLGVAQSSLMSLISPVSKAVTNNKEQYTVCQDYEYTERNLATTPFCNLRHGFDAATLAIDPEDVLNYMKPYMNEETGEPLSDDNDYAKYIKNCIDRTVSIGGFTEDNNNKGDECIQGKGGENEQKYRMFRLAYFDQSILAGMDDENTPEPVSNDTGTVVPDGKWTNPAPFNYRISNPYGPNHDGIDLAGRGTFVSACSGTIKSIGNHGDSNGRDGDPKTNIIVIDCGSGITTKYMHYYYSTLAPGISVGAKVTAGQKLADVGNQGNSTGPHLHYQVEQNGQIIDPAKFMQKMGVTF